MMAGLSEIEVKDSIDHLFRHHAGQMVSVLCRIFGFERIDLIEDAVQDALIAALRKWPFAGIPENPSAWLIQAARNRVIDHLRRETRFESTIDGLDIVDRGSSAQLVFSSEVGEDQLRMIFACCHPAISPDIQVALTLKIVGGFSIAEIASAYLAKEDSVAKMITRAKARLRSERLTMDIPVARELTERLDAVLKVLYLMFNEGHGASGGNELVRRDLCFEAVRLVELIAEHPMTSLPTVHAAAALFCFQASRLSARADHSGELILLADQNRQLWDQHLIGKGIRHFHRSASGDELSPFHLEAEIAAVYTLSRDYASIDRQRILECYELLQRVSFSRVAELNRIVVVGQLNGPEAALDELDGLTGMESHNLYHITRGHFLAGSGRTDEARRSFELAYALTKNQAVQRFIGRKLGSLSPAPQGQ